MTFLFSQLNAADRAAVNESNAPTLDQSLAFIHRPSFEPGTQAATTNLGPPALGDWPEFSLWVDAACAVWRRTASGWAQVQPAIVDDVSTLSDIPNNYLIVTPSQKWGQFYYD